MILAVRPRNGKIPQITDACYCFLGFGSVLAVPLASGRRFSSGQKSLDFLFPLFPKAAFGIENLAAHIDLRVVH